MLQYKIKLKKKKGTLDECAHSLGHVQLVAVSWTVAFQAPLSMGFSRQECWSGLPCPPPGDLPNPGMEPMSLVSPALGGRFLTTSATRGAPYMNSWGVYYRKKEKWAECPKPFFGHTAC